MKIGVFQLANKKERIDFWSSMEVSILDQNLKNLTNFDILFYHTSDTADLNVAQQKILFDYKGWKIAYTGEQNIPVKVNYSQKTASTFSWDTIQENYQYFKQKINEGENVKDAIEALIGLDKLLEKYLEPFAAINPFKESNDRGDNLISAKTTLQSYISEYLKKQAEK